MPLQTKKAVVTGGAGFIGSHLLCGLIEAGWSVVVVDNLIEGKCENVPPEVLFVEADVRDT
ncbi:NAD-dependent epimerase/dehydratase family protein, partial [bacterium]